MLRRSLALVSAVLLAVLGLLSSTHTAQAAPPTAAWSASSGGDVANVGLSVTGLTLANARLANSSAASASTASPRSQSIARNIAAAVAGLPIAVASNSQTAPPDNAGPVTGTLASVSAVGIGVGALATSNEAHWLGDTSCVTTAPLAATTTTTAGLSINPLGLANILTTGVSSTTGTTALVSTGGNGLNRAVQSQARGSITGVSVLGGAVTVDVVGQAVLTTTAAGTTGNAIVAYTAPIVRVTEGGNTQTVALGSNVTLDLGAVGSVQVAVNNPTVTTAANGTSATATVNTVSLVVRAGPAALPIANATIQLVPLRASAVAPSGGIDCPPPAPVLNQPANDSVTNDATPTFSGTGVAGASINLTLDGTGTANVATVTAGGTWSYTPTTDIADGAYTASVTQTLNGSTSPASNENDFTIDTAAPAAPVVVQPANGSVTSDTTPLISGTGPATTDIEVFVDGASVGTTTTTAGGAWQLTSPTVTNGSHTAYAVAIDAAGNNSAQSNTTTFTVDATAPAAPVITAPADGSTIADPTPTVTGTGEPGATVAVSIDGTPLGTAAVAGTGSWSVPVTTTLADGPHTVEAEQSDAAGNDSTVASNDFTVDTAAPAAPVVVTPANGSTTGATPTVTGTAEANADVEVFVDGASIGTTTASGTGAWQLVVPTALSPGSHQVYAVATDAGGNTSPQSNTNTFTVDTTAPAAPVLQTPADGSSTNDTTPTITGTAEAGATVEILVDGISIGTVPATGGTFSLTVPTALADGPHEAYAVATDAAGNDSPPSNTNTFTVDTDAPAAPVITAPADGSTIADPTPTITGTGEPGATVSVSIDGTLVGTTPVQGNGAWSFPLVDPLPDGPHDVSAVQSDPAGNDSGTATASFTVDTTAPAAPVLQTPADGSSTNDTTPTITGTAEPGAVVEVFVDGASIGTTTATGGSFSLAVPTALTAGSHEAYAVATDAAGNDSAQSNTNTFTVDVTSPAAPVLQSPADGSTTNDTTPAFSGTAEAGASVEVFVDGASIGTATATGGTFSLVAPAALADGPHEAYAVATDAAGNFSDPSNTNAFTVDTDAPAIPVITAPADGSTITDSTPTITGTGEPGATITVSVDGTEVGTAPVQTDGSWSFPLTDPLDDGPHDVSAVQTDPAGNDSGPATTSFAVDSTAPAAPVVVTPANGSTTGPTPTISGSSDPSVEVEVFVDDISIGTVTATPAGIWQLPVTTALTPGNHSVYAVASDAVGNTSAESNTNTFTVDTTAPVAPVVQTPADGSRTNDTTPTVTGTAEAGARIEVFVDGASIGTTTATGGTFSLTVPTALAAGSHQVYAVATDPVGNISDQSDTNAFTVDTTAPDAPTITQPTDGAATEDTTPTVAGTAEPGSTVTVIIDDQPVGTAPTDGDGAWSLTPTTPLGAGEHEITATAQDEAGNVSPRAPVVRLRVAVIADPVITTPAQDSVVTTLRPRIAGTGQPGATITVSFVDGDVVGTATVGADGTWSLVVDDALTPGTYTVQATQTSAPYADRQSNQLRFRVVAADAEIEPPVITSPGSDVVADAFFPVCGTGEPGAAVTLVDQDDTVLGRTIVDSDGTWCVRLRLAAGDYTLTAIQIVDGEERRSAPLSITVGSGSGSGSGSGGLAETGGPSLGLSALGGLLFSTAVLVLIRRRRSLRG